jgi:hypothetical protein
VVSPGAGFAAAALLPRSDKRIVVGVFFADVTGRPTKVDIHGPAGPGSNAPVIFELPVLFVQRLGANRWQGEAAGYFNLTAQQLADLRAGNWYIDVHTQKQPNGELRGQFLPLIFEAGSSASVGACRPNDWLCDAGSSKPESGDGGFWTQADAARAGRILIPGPLFGQEVSDVSRLIEKRFSLTDRAGPRADEERPKMRR